MITTMVLLTLLEPNLLGLCCAIVCRQAIEAMLPHCARVVPQLMIPRFLSVTGGGTEAFGDNIAQAANGTDNVYQTKG